MAQWSKKSSRRIARRFLWVPQEGCGPLPWQWWWVVPTVVGLLFVSGASPKHFAKQNISHCVSNISHSSAYITNPYGFISLQSGYTLPYSSICFPKKAAATCASFISVSVSGFPSSESRKITEPAMSPDAIIGYAIDAVTSSPTIG